MDLKTLNEWTETPEGEAWLNEKKQGVLSKNTELLQALKAANGGLSETSQRLADTEKALEIERAAIKRALLDVPLENSLAGKVFPVIIPALRNELIQSYGLDVKTIDDGSRAAIGTIEQDGVKVEKTLSEIIDLWAQTEGAKSYLIPQNTTVVSTCIAANGRNSQGQQLDDLSGRQLAAMSEQDFQNAVKDKLGQ